MVSSLAVRMALGQRRRRLVKSAFREWDRARPRQRAASLRGELEQLRARADRGEGAVEQLSEELSEQLLAQREASSQQVSSVSSELRAAGERMGEALAAQRAEAAAELQSAREQQQLTAHAAADTAAVEHAETVQALRREIVLADEAAERERLSMQALRTERDHTIADNAALRADVTAHEEQIAATAAAAAVAAHHAAGHVPADAVDALRAEVAVAKSEHATVQLAAAQERHEHQAQRRAADQEHASQMIQLRAELADAVHAGRQEAVALTQQTQAQIRPQLAVAAEERRQLEQNLGATSRLAKQQVKMLEEQLASVRLRADNDIRALQSEVDAAKQQNTRFTSALDQRERLSVQALRTERDHAIADNAALRADVTAHEEKLAISKMELIGGTSQHSDEMASAEQRIKAQAEELARLRPQLLRTESALQTEVERCAELKTGLVLEREKIAGAEIAIRSQFQEELAHSKATTQAIKDDGWNRVMSWTELQQQRKQKRAILRAWAAMTRLGTYVRLAAGSTLRRTRLQRLQKDFRQWAAKSYRSRMDQKNKLQGLQSEAAAAEADKLHAEGQTQIATLSAHCKDLEQKIVTMRTTVAEQLVTAERSADERVSETEHLHEDRRELLHQEMAARLATAKETGQRNVEIMQQKCAVELADSESTAQARLSMELERVEHELHGARAARQLEEAATVECQAECRMWNETAESLMASRLRKHLMLQCFTAWRWRTRSSVDAVSSLDTAYQQKWLQGTVLQAWFSETQKSAHRQLLARRHGSRALNCFLAFQFERWVTFRLNERVARRAIASGGLARIGKYFRQWADTVRTVILHNQVRSSAARELALVQTDLGIAGQRVEWLEQELVESADRASSSAHESDERADERVQLIEEAMERRIENLRQEAQLRIVQVERTADIQYQKLLASAKSELGSAEQTFAARSMQSEADLAEAKEQADASVLAMRTGMEQTLIRLQQADVELKRDAAEELADLDSIMSQKCAETEWRAEHLVSRVRDEADQKIRLELQAAGHANDLKIVEANEMHRAEIDTIDRRVQEEIDHSKFELEAQLRAALSDATTFREEAAKAVDRADAAESRTVVCAFR